MVLKNPFDKIKYPNCYEGHNYALDIIKNKIRSNVWIKGACERYLRDIKTAKNKKPPFIFRADKAEKFLRIVQKFDHPVGHWETQNIIYEPWQKFIWMNIKGFYSTKTKMVRFRTAHIDVARGNAKALSLDTEIPTPTGIKLFNDVKVGDKVFDRRGKICNVIGETEIHFPKSYKMVLDRGVEIKTSDKHLWFVDDKNARRNRKYKEIKNIKLNEYDYERIITTEEIFNEGLIKRKEANFAIKTFKSSLDLKTKKLPVEPYFLGYWLGDGAKSCARITVDKKDLKNVIDSFKSLNLKLSEVKYKKESNWAYFTVYNHHVIFKKLNILNNKHIPNVYLKSSKKQRLELLRGLFDSDGSISEKNNKGCVSFVTIYEHLAKDVMYLLSSLGFKNVYKKYKITSKSKGNNDYYYRITFTPTVDVDLFKFERKKSRQVREKRSFTQHNYFYVKELKEIKPQPMKCIQVDSKDGSFLITRNCIPTHNSTMASQATLYDLCCDNPNGNRVYCAATSRDQAKEVLNGAQIMARKNPSFRKNFGVDVRAHEILHPNSNSYIKAISAQANSLDGKIGQLIVTDELHAMQRKTFEVLDSGQSKRKDSLLLSITTAGYANDGVGFSQRKYAQKVALGEVIDDTFFSMVYRLDEDDSQDIFNEENWIKANPNLGISVDPDNFRAKAKKAKENPEDSSNFKIKHLNMYLDSLNQLMDVHKWKALRDSSIKIEDFQGETCYVGIDLASKIDITSVCYMFKKDNKFYPFWKNFIPSVRVNDVKNRAYLTYVEQGDLTALEGEVVNIPKIQDIIMEDSKKYKFLDVFYDPWSATEMATRLMAKGLNMTEFRMNTSNLSEPTKRFQANIIEGTFTHNTKEMLEWCVGNVVGKYDAVGNVFPRKEHESLKIDPIIAAIMSLAGWIADEERESVYETRGIIIL